MNELNFVNIPDGVLKEIVRSMANKAAIVNMHKRDGDYADNIRKCPIYSELKGMEQMLKLMGIDFNYDFDDTVQYITGIEVNNLYFKVV